MKSIRTIFILSVILITAACSPSRNKSADAIGNLEKILFSPQSTSFDLKKADSLMAMYEQFVSDFPTDSLSPVYTFRAANLAMNANNGPKALELFDLYLTKYPDQPKAEVSLFFKGYVNENIIKNLDKAREIYLIFLEKYPKSEFADDARLALQNLGKSPEEMFREFERKQKADSIRKADSVAAIAAMGKKRK